VLWLFLFTPGIGLAAYGLRRLGVDWNFGLRGEQAMLLVIVAAAWKQISYNFLFFLARAAVDPEIADRGGLDRRRRPHAAFWTIIMPLLSPTTFFLVVVDIVYAFFDTFGIIHSMTGGGPREGNRDPRLQGLLRRRRRARPRRLFGRIGDPHGDRHGAHRDPVPLRRAQGALLMTRPRRLDWLPHLVLIAGALIVAFPIYVTFVASTLERQDILAAPMPLLPGAQLVRNYLEVLASSTYKAGNQPVAHMLINSLVMASGHRGSAKIAISILSAYAVVFFRFPLRQTCFWMIFITLMLPVEVRIVPTYKVVSDLGMVNSFAGLTIPAHRPRRRRRCCSAVLLTVPDELVEAAKIDGAGPLRFFLGHRRAAVAHQYRRRSSSFSSSTAGTSISGRCSSPTAPT